MRYIYFFLLLGAIFSVMYTYSSKYQTIANIEEREKLKQKVEHIKEEIRMLTVELQKLKRPDRIQMLAEKHLQMKKISSEDILSSFAELPDLKKPEPSSLLDQLNKKDTVVVKQK